MGFLLTLDGRFENADDEQVFVDAVIDLMADHGDACSTVKFNTDFHGSPTLKAPIETQAPPTPVADPTTERLNKMEANIAQIAAALGQSTDDEPAPSPATDHDPADAAASTDHDPADAAEFDAWKKQRAADDEERVKAAEEAARLASGSSSPAGGAMPGGTPNPMLGRPWAPPTGETSTP